MLTRGPILEQPTARTVEFFLPAVVSDIKSVRPIAVWAFKTSWLGGIEMLRLCLRGMLVVGIGMTGAACVDNGYGSPSGYYQPAPTGYGNPYYNSGYYSPAPAPQYGYSQPAPYYGYANQQGNYGG